MRRVEIRTGQFPLSLLPQREPPSLLEELEIGNMKNQFWSAANHKRC
jgi:hypothetical protein